MKIDGGLMVANPSQAGPAARRLEELGYAGAFTFEGPHDPFLPLAVAAETTTRIELFTAIAVAFARNPMLLAHLAWDLQLQSRGRFMLGLGSQIQPHIEKRFSMPWSRPAARMREMVLAIRAIWRRWQEGEKLDFRGEFYTHTLMTPMFDPGKNPHGPPRVFLAGVGPAMTEVAGEVADGFFVHPFHTPDFVRDTTLPALANGFRKSGRRREDFEIACQVIVASGEDAERLEKAKQACRAHIAFYGSTPAYRPVLESLGRGELQTELNQLSKRGAWHEMGARIDDEILERVAVVGTPDEIAGKLRARCGAFADRVSLVSQAAPDPAAWAHVVRDLAASRSG